MVKCIKEQVFNFPSYLNYAFVINISSVPICMSSDAAQYPRWDEDWTCLSLLIIWQ